uniref:Uncharacterized protein n=1 Tax=Rhizophora mucronata TaxID=61149 RepID=A0A2P2NSB1_RHIMU
MNKGYCTNTSLFKNKQRDRK